jgi:hypothetical protein
VLDLLLDRSKEWIDLICDRSKEWTRSNDGSNLCSSAPCPPGDYEGKFDSFLTLFLFRITHSSCYQTRTPTYRTPPLPYTIMAPQKKISVAEAHQWIKNAIAQCTLEATESEELTQDFFDETRPVDFKEPKAPKASKDSKDSKDCKDSKKSSTSSDASDRSEEGYDPDRCDARASKKQQGVRFDFQCASKQLDGECFCKNHLKKFQTEKGLELGKITDDRPTHWDDGKVIAWHDADPELLATLKKKTPKKVTSTDESGEKIPRKCSLCGSAGHNKRKCPDANKTPESPEADETPKTDEIVDGSDGFTVGEIASPKPQEIVQEILTEIIDKVSSDEETASPKPQLNESEEQEISDMVEDDGAGTGLKSLVLEMDDSATEPLTDASDASDGEESPEPEKFLFQGVAYERECTGDKCVFDEEGDTIGTWTGESIEFASTAQRKEHEKRVAELGEGTPQSTTTEDLLEMAVKDLRKMAKIIGISQDDMDDALDTDKPKDALVHLIENVQFVVNKQD